MSIWICLISLIHFFDVVEVALLCRRCGIAGRLIFSVEASAASCCFESLKSALICVSASLSRFLSK